MCQHTASVVIIASVCVFYNDLEETSKPGKRRTRGPGEDISDIEHLLDDQSTSEFTRQVIVCFIVVLFVCTFMSELIPSGPKAKRQKQDASVAKRLFNASQTQGSKAPTHGGDITPPSSPEQYEPSHTLR